MTEIQGKRKRKWYEITGCFWTGAAVVVILVILAALAIPDFMKVPHHSPQREVKTNLGAIFTGHVSYHGEFNDYPRSPDVFEKLAWRPEGQNRYSYYCSDEVIPCHPSRCEIPPPTPGPGWPFPVKPAATEGTFTCIAVGNVDNDETWDVWTINEQKDLRNVINDIND